MHSFAHAALPCLSKQYEWNCVTLVSYWFLTGSAADCIVCGGVFCCFLLSSPVWWPAAQNGFSRGTRTSPKWTFYFKLETCNLDIYCSAMVVSAILVMAL